MNMIIYLHIKVILQNQRIIYQIYTFIENKIERGM